MKVRDLQKLIMSVVSTQILLLSFESGCSLRCCYRWCCRFNPIIHSTLCSDEEDTLTVSGALGDNLNTNHQYHIRIVKAGRSSWAPKIWTPHKLIWLRDGQDGDGVAKWERVGLVRVCSLSCSIVHFVAHF